MDKIVRSKQASYWSNFVARRRRRRRRRKESLSDIKWYRIIGYHLARM